MFMLVPRRRTGSTDAALAAIKRLWANSSSPSRRRFTRSHASYCFLLCRDRSLTGGTRGEVGDDGRQRCASRHEIQRPLEALRAVPDPPDDLRTDVAAEIAD